MNVRNILRKGTKLSTLELVGLMVVLVRLAAEMVDGGIFDQKLAREKCLLAANGRHHRGILCPRRQFLLHPIRLHPCIDLASQCGLEPERLRSTREIAAGPHAAGLRLQTQSAVGSTRR